MAPPRKAARRPAVHQVSRQRSSNAPVAAYGAGQLLGGEPSETSADIGDGFPYGSKDGDCDDAGRIISECLQRISEAEGALVHARGALADLLEINSGDTYTEDPGDTCTEPSFFDGMACRSSASPSSATGDGVNTFVSPAGLRGISVPEEVIRDGKEVENANREADDGLLIMDQILLDSRIEVEEADIEENGVGDRPPAAIQNLGREDRCYQNPRRLPAEKPTDDHSRSRSQHVLATVGRNPETGRAESVYVDRNRPIWVLAGTGCCSRIRIPVWHPEAEIRLVWNLVGFIFIVFEAFLIPFYIAFKYEPTGYIFSIVSVVNTYFIVDVMFSFFTGFMDGGTTVCTASRIGRRYACTWFVPDVLSGIPWEWLPTQQSQTGSLTKCFRFIKGLRLLRATRLLKMMKMGSLTDAIEIIVESNRLFVFAFGVVRVMFLLFFVTHWSACFWFIVGSNPDVDEHKTWISNFLEGVDDVGTKYIYAMYFTLTTMTTVGYGDMSPQNVTEIRFVLVLLLVASVVFAGLMGALTDLVFNLNNESNLRSERKVMLSRYMRWRAVPSELFMEVREHLLFLWETNDSFDEYEAGIKDMLSPVLKKELSYHIYGSILRAAPFLAWIRGCDVCLKELAQVVESMFLSKGDYLFHVGQPNEHLYVFLKGTLYISQNEKLSLAPANKPHKEDEGGLQAMTDFAIPRNKEANAGDIFNMFMKSAAKSVHPKTVVEQKKQERVLDMMVGQSLTDLKEEEEEEEQRVKAQEAASQDILESHVDSSVLHLAFKKLHRQDQREKKAACYIQRRWRRNHGKVLEPTVSAKRLSTARSKFVHAPAYLGESCLWDPLEEWDSDRCCAKPYPYAARLETRGEFVYIARKDIKDIIDRFSPWLAARFEFFRLCVVDSIKKAEMGEDEEGASCVPGPQDTEASNGQAPPPAAVVHVEPAPESSPGQSEVHDHHHSDPHAIERSHNHDMVAREMSHIHTEHVLPHVHEHPGGYHEHTEGQRKSLPNGYGLRGINPATPLSVAMEQRAASRGVFRGGSTSRSFRAAAAAAIARVSVHVTPPSENATPRQSSHHTPCITPRHDDGHHGGRATPTGPLTEPLLGASSSSQHGDMQARS